MRWDFYEEFRRLEREMNRLFQEFWGRPFMGGQRLLGTGKTEIEPYKGELDIREPFTDIHETEKEVIVAAEIPGVDKKDIKINVTEDDIEISAETKHETREEKEGYFHRERSYGGFYRCIRLPSTVNPNKAKATYNNGVLEIKLPKVKVSEKTRIKVE